MAKKKPKDTLSEDILDALVTGGKALLTGGASTIADTVNDRKAEMVGRAAADALTGPPAPAYQDVRHWQARLEDRPIEEGISAMEYAPGHRDRLTDADRKFYRDKYERRDTRFVPRPDEWKRMTDYEKSLWLGPEEAPLDVAIQESLGKDRERITDADVEYWRKQIEDYDLEKKK